MFETKDVFGKPIKLKASTWDKHIMIEHEEVAGHVQEIKSTVESPSIVYESASDPTRKVFFAQHSTSKYPKLYLKVIADYKEPVAIITTAMFSKKIDGVKGDGLLYAKR